MKGWIPPLLIRLLADEDPRAMAAYRIWTSPAGKAARRAAFSIVNSVVLKRRKVLFCDEKGNRFKRTFKLGKPIGSGRDRLVFDCPWDESLILKFEDRNGFYRFANVVEWTVWNRLKDSDLGAHWLAPCRAISKDGRWLLMEKCVPIEEPPSTIPVCFAGDLNPDNWMGKRFPLSLRPVLVDYVDVTFSLDWSPVDAVYHDMPDNPHGIWKEEPIG